jgi:uncharacterized protein (DUF362 family)
MPSRRQFLQLVGGAGLVLAGCRKQAGEGAAAEGPHPEPANAPSVKAERVVVVRDPSAVKGTEVSADKAAALVERAMAELSPAGQAKAAWQALFRPTDVVAIKVNCLAGPPLSSHPEVVRAVVRGLRDSVGIPASSIIVYDRLGEELAAAGFTRESVGECTIVGNDEAGYDDEPTTIGSAGSCYSRVISQQATAIVNVPLLKDHDLAGLSGALKNHFGSIHNPNKMHTDHCTPYVADVNCAPFLREKHRLVVYDALLACYEGGPSCKPGTTASYGAVMVAVDPVAADAVAFRLIETLRKEHGLPPITGSERAPRYIRVAADAEHRLGIADLGKIDLRELVRS